MSAYKMKPKEKALNWALWTVAIVALTNIPVIFNVSFLEYLIRVFLVGAILGGIVYFLVWIIWKSRMS